MPTDLNRMAQIINGQTENIFTSKCWSVEVGSLLLAAQRAEKCHIYSTLMAFGLCWKCPNTVNLSYVLCGMNIQDVQPQQNSSFSQEWRMPFWKAVAGDMRQSWGFTRCMYGKAGQELTPIWVSHDISMPHATFWYDLPAGLGLRVSEWYNSIREWRFQTYWALCKSHHLKAWKRSAVNVLAITT